MINFKDELVLSRSKVQENCVVKRFSIGRKGKREAFHAFQTLVQGHGDNLRSLDRRMSQKDCPETFFVQ